MSYTIARAHEEAILSQTELDVLSRVENAASNADREEEPIRFDLAGILPADDSPTLFFGSPAACKTWIALALCDAIVAGHPFVGIETQRRPRALYINLDAGPKTFRNRVRRVSGAGAFDYITLEAAEATPRVIRALFAQYRGAFIAMDCLSAIYNPDTTKDPAFAMRIFVDNLRALYAAHDCGGLIIDHPHRPKQRGELGDYYGSIQKEGAFRSMLLANADGPLEGDNGHRRSVTLTCRKLSEGRPFSPIRINIDFSGSRVQFTRGDTQGALVDRMAEIDALVLAEARHQSELFTQRSLTDKIRNVRTVDARAAFDRLVSRGELVDSGKRRGPGILFRAASHASGPRPDSLFTSRNGA